jgi:hypothetical protein
LMHKKGRWGQQATGNWQQANQRLNWNF